MKKMIALLLCVTLCVTVLGACKKEEPVDPKTLIPQHTVPEEGADGQYTVSEWWELNENITCLEFNERGSATIHMADGTLKDAMDISMYYIDDAENPHYVLVLGGLLMGGFSETLYCTVTKDGTQWAEGTTRLLYLGYTEQEVSWGFYSWLQANAKPTTI